MVLSDSPCSEEGGREGGREDTMLVPFPFRHAVTDHSVCVSVLPHPPLLDLCDVRLQPSLLLPQLCQYPRSIRVQLLLLLQHRGTTPHHREEGAHSSARTRARVCACVCVLGALQQVLVRVEGDRQQRTQCMACLAQSPFGLLVSPGGSPGAEGLSPPPVADRRETGFNT